jgi:ferredoxin
MRVVINEELCTGCGVCESLCPEVFKMEDDEKAHVVNQEGCGDCDCQEAVDSCPSEAISMEEE